MIDIYALPSHPRNNGRDGYLYVIELSSGGVKVGRTTNPRARISQHIQNAAAHEVAVTDLWLSKLHENYAENETALIRSLGTPYFGNEYFAASFMEAVSVAIGLNYRFLTDRQRAERDFALDAELEERVKAFVDEIWGDGLPGDGYVAVRVLADEAPVLKLLYSEELPQGFVEDHSLSGDALRLHVEKMAQASGIPIDQIESWSYLDVIEHLAIQMIRLQRKRLQIMALEAGRLDLVREPVFGATS